MKTTTLIRLSAAAGALLLAACSKDSTAPSSLINQATLTTDVASTAGDGIALDVTTLSGDETAAALPASTAAADRLDVTGAVSDSVAWSRSRTCLDSAGTGVPCIPLDSVRTIVTHISFYGSRSGVAENGATFSGVLSRVGDDTLTRNFTGTTETSRTHNGVAIGADTTTFKGPNVTRIHQSSGVDSVEAVTFDLPRSTNPWPVSGKIVRNVAVYVSVTSANKTQTTTITKRVEVDFPADAQGNVTLHIDNQTCNLNLVTHSVSNCH